MTDTNIVDTMTIQEAAAVWTDQRRVHLRRWAETFEVPLKELHYGHVLTYLKDRGEETTSSEVDAEVEALLALLKEKGLGGEIERYIRPISETGELTAVEIRALPEAARKYTSKLKQQIADLQSTSARLENRIRRTNWGRSR